MELLRETLKILYLKRSPNQILSYLSDPNLFVDERLDTLSFQKHLSLVMKGQSTLDNARIVEKHLKHNWMKGSETPYFAYANRETIFNVLLHFSSEVLTEKELEPVCYYEHLLRWHELTSYLSEDLLITSFLASRDIFFRRERYSFLWLPVIKHDNRSLNLLFERPMMDLHFHLNGSSLNFDINWMSLMNHTSGWNKAFERLKIKQSNNQQIIEYQYDEPSYLCVMKASVLRMLLFEYVVYAKSVKGIPLTDYKLAEKVLNAGSIKEAIPLVKKLDIISQRMRYIYGKKYSSNDGSLRVPDYAILDKHINGISKDDKKYALSVLSGERWLMYELFSEIYSHKNIDKRIVGWFYVYILYKIRFRSEMVQNNAITGFANFAEYEKRKSLFIKECSVYDTLLSQLAVVSSLSPSENKWLEVRITPKDSRKALIKHIQKTMDNIGDSHFISNDASKRILNKYGFVLHFIKREDKNYKPSGIEMGQCRHYDLRFKVKRQAYAIANLRKSLNPERNSILGIDAANSEIFARPEVFAQAFRFLRNSTDEVKGAKMLKDLGITYHAGEDFLDVVDGLRAIDELLQFMGFREGDRIGHGMVLGIGVKEYYSHAHNNVILQIQDLLDNVVWLYCKGKSLPSFIPASKSLEILFETFFRKIYGNLRIKASIWDYYQSWLLRGDNPQYYRHCNQDGRHTTNSRWSMYNLNDNEDARDAASNPIARALYEAYHFNPDVRKKGTETRLEHFSDEVVEYVTDVQRLMLMEIEHKHIGIECNPTSNLKIGHFDSYSTHPILKIYNDKLHTDEDLHSISVTINTDDKGIFTTSLEREFSLLALSLEKKYVKTGKCLPRVIYEWLDSIRKMSAEQRF